MREKESVIKETLIKQFTRRIIPGKGRRGNLNDSYVLISGEKRRERTKTKILILYLGAMEMEERTKCFSHQ